MVCEYEKQQPSNRLSESESNRNDLVKRISQMEQDLAAAATQQEQMQRGFNDMVATAAGNQAERDKLAQRVGQLTQDGKNSADTIAKLTSDRERSTHAESKALKENCKLLKVIADSNAQLNKTSEKIAKLETARGQLTVQLAGLLGDRAALSDQVKILTDERDQLYERHASLLKKRLYCPNKPTKGDVLFWAFIAVWLVASIIAGIDMYRRDELPRLGDPWRGVRMCLCRREEARRLRDETDKPVPDTKLSIPAPDGTVPAVPEPASSEFEAPASPRALDSQVRHCHSRLDLVEGVVSDTARRVGEHDSLLRERADKATSASGSADADKRVDSNGTDLSCEDGTLTTPTLFRRSSFCLRWTSESLGGDISGGSLHSL